MKYQRQAGGWLVLVGGRSGFIPHSACPHGARSVPLCPACLDDLTWSIRAESYAPLPKGAGGFVTMFATEADIVEAREIEAYWRKRLGNRVFAKHKDVCWTGFLAELLAVRWLLSLGVDAKLVKKRIWENADIWIEAPPGRVEVDVKCAERKGPPRISYTSAMTAKQQHPRKSGWTLLFASYEVDRRRMTFVGALTMVEMLSRAKLVRKGGYVHKNLPEAHEEMLNVEMSKMTPPRAWAQSLRSARRIDDADGN